jgi:quaternary ammonium compound-resistance protein SugE
MAWLALVVAGLLEVAWAQLLPVTRGFTRISPTLACLGLLATSIFGLSYATRTLPLGTAYAVWVGIGTVGTVLVSLAVRGDAATPARLTFLVLIVAGVIGLKLVD